MRARDGRPPGVPCWMDTAPPDPHAAMGFYGDLFGWAFEDRTPPGGRGRYFVATLEGRRVAGVGSDADRSTTPAWRTYVDVDDLDDVSGRVRHAGGSVLAEPFEVLDGVRAGAVADPSGAAFRLWQASELTTGDRPGSPGSIREGAQLVNAPGTWSWSDLGTGGVAAATAFYGAVFGWEVDTVDLGDFEGTMVRLPGYGDFLARRDPDLRRRHADIGVLRDPQGAVLSVNTFDPE